ncbi:Hypothetical predicted protein [Podarcis lilfordi]|uniref:Uncharacterized protein n=1 Tax=Podarcis lilfordi TaxID=74358 RepID=A0AA35PQC3_9SAUR|nr:Hypothetical predicted protein [Podarcis lilfordi]
MELSAPDSARNGALLIACQERSFEPGPLLKGPPPSPEEAAALKLFSRARQGQGSGICPRTLESGGSSPVSLPAK